MSIRRVLLAMFLALVVFSFPGSTQNSGGMIQGSILYTGVAPKAQLLSMAKDPNCLKINAGKKTFEDKLLVSPMGQVRNVFVHLKSGLSKKSFPVPAQPITL